MATEVKMPRLSLTMEVGTIIQWLKAPGDQVEKGEDLAEIETDKVNVALEAPSSGYLRSVFVEAGVEVPCDTPIALVTATADEPLEEVAGATLPPASAVDAAPTGQPAVARTTPPSAPSTAGGRPHLNATPAAKNLARQLGIDLAALTGTGPGGRIGMEDVQRAADSQAATPGANAHEDGTPGAGSRTMPLGKMRAAIAQRMVLSATTVPQFTVRRRVDLTRALRFRRERVAAAGDGRTPSLIDVIHLAAIRALLTHPRVNGSFQAGSSPDQGSITLHDGIDLGIAVSLPDGLIVPVIHNAHTMSVEALAAERVRLQEEVLTGRMAASALGGATFTVSNLGPMNVDEFTAIVNPPEAAILAVGRMQETVVVREGGIHIVPMITLTVTADHRILDGADVARFLDTLAGNLDRLEG